MIQSRSRAQLAVQARLDLAHFDLARAVAGLLIVGAILFFMLTEGRVPQAHHLAATYMLLTMGAWCLAGAYFMKYTSTWMRVILSVVPTGLTILSLYLVIVAGQNLGSAL